MREENYIFIIFIMTLINGILFAYMNNNIFYSYLALPSLITAYFIIVTIKYYNKGDIDGKN